MAIFNFSQYDGEIPDEEVVFSTTKQYTNPSSETEARKQLSTPLYQLKTFINSLFDSNNKIVASNLPSATTSTQGAMSSSDKTKLNGIESGAEANVIETVKVNGSALTPSEKAVDITLTTLTNLIYPVGSVYLSVSSTSPSTLFGGTWEQITTDAYLKIVTSNAGSAGGTSSEHKIPIESMPSHSHALSQIRPITGRPASTGLNQLLQKIAMLEEPMFTDTAGYGDAYYPYYVGVYVWKRTA